MNETDTNDSAKRLQKIIDAGIELVPGAGGNAAAAVIGFLVGGPVGAAAGGFTGWAVSKGLERLGREFSERALGPREEARVGCVLALAVRGIRERIESGEQLRPDGFFQHTSTHRSGAEEVLENILLKSQREPEEKKLPYMANLFASIAFDSTISAEMAHQIAKTAGDLTFRQLCILRLGAIKDEFDLRESDYRGQKSFAKELYPVLYECLGLYSLGYINFGGEVLFGPTDVKPASMTLQGLGADTHNLMRLSDIPRDEIAPIASTLRSDGKNSRSRHTE